VTLSLLANDAITYRLQKSHTPLNQLLN